MSQISAGGSALRSAGEEVGKGKGREAKYSRGIVRGIIGLDGCAVSFARRGATEAMGLHFPRLHKKKK